MTGEYLVCVDGGREGFYCRRTLSAPAAERMARCVERKAWFRGAAGSRAVLRSWAEGKVCR